MRLRVARVPLVPRMGAGCPITPRTCRPGTRCRSLREKRRRSPRARLGLSGTLAARLDGEPRFPTVRTLADLKADPERLVDAADLARIGLVGSYGGITRWVTSGGLPEPYLLPGRRMAWRAGDVLAAVAPRRKSPPGGTTAVSESAPPLAVTVIEAARTCDLSKSSLYEALAKGEIEAVRAGRRTLVLGDSLRAYIQRQPRYRPTLGRKAPSDG
jgi:excisionase family DNA binding protein